jgi:uncharacterized protein YndB with AHSA1/START domain
MPKNETIIQADPGRPDLTIIREFEAPRELVFRAHTDAEMYAKWLGPRGEETRFHVFEPRTGGAWRFTQKDPEGNEYGFHGSFHEVTAPERIIQTFEFEGMPEPGHVSLETLRLETLPGNRTRLVAQSVFQSVGDRDGMIESGMESGVNEGYEKLDQLLHALVAAR